MLHRNSTLNHKIENWTYADAAARTGASGFVSGDIGKIARQTDTGVYYRLTATTPTWVPMVTVIARYLASPAIPAGATANVDCSTGDTFQERLLAANTTLTLTNLADGQVVVVPVKNTTAPYTLTWVGIDEWKGTGGVAPVLSTGAKTDVFTFVKCGAKVFGSVAVH